MEKEKIVWIIRKSKPHKISTTEAEGVVYGFDRKNSKHYVLKEKTYHSRYDCCIAIHNRASEKLMEAKKLLSEYQGHRTDLDFYYTDSPYAFRSVSYKHMIGEISDLAKMSERDSVVGIKKGISLKVVLGSILAKSFSPITRNRSYKE